MKTKWSAADTPYLKDRIAIITGAHCGIGYEIALPLAAHGAHAILAARDAERSNSQDASLRGR
jgi:NAD(P)-dependent dehydrogenase (short-subunit alcohol dehydrogenase family)